MNPILVHVGFLLLALSLPIWIVLIEDWIACAQLPCRGAYCRPAIYDLFRWKKK